MPTIIGAEPTTGVRVCPRSHTQSFIYYITCSVLLYAIKVFHPKRSSEVSKTTANNMVDTQKEIKEVVEDEETKGFK